MSASSLDSINQFMSYPEYAVIGVSRNQKGFGWQTYNHLKKGGYSAFPVNRFPGTYNGLTYYGSVSSIPQAPKAAVVVTPASENRTLIQDLITQGIEAIWLQPGAVSEEAVQVGLQNNLVLVYGWCILMFAEPVRSIHWLHRKYLEVTGRMPR
ncbi:MAG: CoA-binding protein [Bacillota bacterium]